MAKGGSRTVRNVPWRPTNTGPRTPLRDPLSARALADARLGSALDATFYRVRGGGGTRPSQAEALGAWEARSGAELLLSPGSPGAPPPRAPSRGRQASVSVTTGRLQASWLAPCSLRRSDPLLQFGERPAPTGDTDGNGGPGRSWRTRWRPSWRCTRGPPRFASRRGCGSSASRCAPTPPPPPPPPHCPARSRLPRSGHGGRRWLTDAGAVAARGRGRQTDNITWKKNRNSHVRLLIEQLKRGHLDQPYDKHPDPGPLGSLPGWMKLGYGDLGSHRETSFVGYPGTSLNSAAYNHKYSVTRSVNQGAGTSRGSGGGGGGEPEYVGNYRRVDKKETIGLVAAAAASAATAAASHAVGMAPADLGAADAATATGAVLRKPRAEVEAQLGAARERALEMEWRLQVSPVRPLRREERRTD